MVQRSSRFSPLDIVDPHGADDQEDHDARERLRDELRQIPVLTPWTTYVAHDASFSPQMNEELAARIQDLIFDELEQCYVRLKKQQEESDMAGIISKRAMHTVLEGRLVVEAKRKINVQQLTHDMKTVMKTAIAMINSPGFSPRHGSFAGRSSHPRSVLDQLLIDKEAEIAAISSATAAAMAVAKFENSKTSQGSSQNPSDERGPQRETLYVEFPASPPRLSELVAQADSEMTTEDYDNQVTNFRQRPVVSSAVNDAGSPVSRRDVRPDRVRYIMSTRVGALPPMKNILDEYPIPKEILDALETHRHYHIDESSFMTSFDSLKAGSTGDWECYFRRSVPLERKPISFVLSSLEIANERPVPPPSDIFQHHLLESATNEDIMLTEVRQLYDHTHESYRDFRASLHRHLDLPYLVDLSLRSSLNSTSYFLEDELVSSEATVQIPDRLYRRSSSLVSKWRLAKKGATGRMTTRRGAIALQVKVEMSKAQRNEMLAKICTFTPNEVQLMDLWHSYDADADEATPFDPIPMRPDMSSRFEAVWKDLSMPAKERLDLAIKYSSLDNSSRLPDAVALWEVTVALIKEREELLRLVRIAIATPKKTVTMIAEEMGLLQDLAQATTHVKEALLLTYIEVGDFVTLGGKFYLVKMEHEATELQQNIVESMEAAKRHTTPEDDALAELSAFANTATNASARTGDRETAHRDTWV